MREDGVVVPEDKHQRRQQVDCQRWTATGCCWQVNFVMTKINRTAWAVDSKVPDGDQLTRMERDVRWDCRGQPIHATTTDSMVLLMSVAVQAAVKKAVRRAGRRGIVAM